MNHIITIKYIRRLTCWFYNIDVPWSWNRISFRCNKYRFIILNFKITIFTILKIIRSWETRVVKPKKNLFRVTFFILNRYLIQYTMLETVKFNYLNFTKLKSYLRLVYTLPWIISTSDEISRRFVIISLMLPT